MVRLIFLLSVLSVTVGSIFLMSGGKEKSKKPPKKAVVKQLSAQEVQPYNEKIWVKYQGLIQARNRMKISSEVPGQILSTGFRLRNGAQVSQGQSILQLDKRSAQLQESNLKAQFLTTLSRFLAEIQQQYPQEIEKWNQFFSKVSQAQSQTYPQLKLPNFSEQREEILAHSMGVSSQFYAFLQQSVLVDKHQIRAPFSGSIIQAQSNIGSRVSPGQYLGELVGKGLYEINLEVPVEVSAFLRKGSSAQVSVEGHTSKLKGKVVRIAQALDARTQTVPVVIQIKSSKEILDGRYGEAEIVASKIPQVFRLSAESLASGDRVYLIKDGQLFDRQVQVILRDPQFVYLSMKDFQPGEWVVNEMFQEFFPGMQVKLRSNKDKSKGEDR